MLIIKNNNKIPYLANSGLLSILVAIKLNHFPFMFSSLGLIINGATRVLSLSIGCPLIA